MASFSVPCPKTSALFTTPKLSPNPSQPQISLSFQSGSQAFLAGSSLRAQGYKTKQSDVFKVSAQQNEVAFKTSSNSVPIPEQKPEVPAIESPADDTIPDSASISTFLAQVADLVELVDSRDIMELQLKQQGLELSIKKKEALEPVVGPMMMMMQQPSQPQPMMPPVSAPAAASPAASSAPPPLLALPGPSKPKSSHPPLKCPMAGTFYRAPGPGAPAFVKVGDKIQKGQVVCIVEAMKLMNEIESDQSGTLVEIVAEDGKPVSVDTPLFIIEP